jgi:hypothetical protein
LRGLSLKEVERCTRLSRYRVYPRVDGVSNINTSYKEVIRVDDQNIIFILTKEDVLECARMKGIPDEAITDDVLRQVRKMVDSGLECWSEVVMTAIDFALKS